MPRRPAGNQSAQFDGSESALNISFSLMSQHYGALLLPGVVFMAACLFLVMVPFLVAEPPSEAMDAQEKVRFGVSVLGSMGLALLLLPIAWVYVRLVVMLTATSILRGEEPEAGQVYGRALTRLPAAVTASFISALFLAFLYSLLFVPGLYFSVRYWFIFPAILFENAGPFTALDKSSDATKGHFWALFWNGMGGYFLAILVLIGVIWAISAIFEDNALTAQDFGLVLLLFFAWPLIGTMSSVIRVVQYWKCVAGREAVEKRIEHEPSPFDPSPAGAPGGWGTPQAS